MSRLILVLALASLAGGCATRTVYVDRPGPVEYVDRPVYVAIPDDLVPVYPIASGGVAQCPVVASDRKAELERANSNSKAIRAIRGTPVPASTHP